MSETHLPNNLAEWPENPYELLGVGQDVDRRNLRRAYVRLIRVFKPEHFPDQFRRIRDAYESIDGFLQYREQYGIGEPAGNEPTAMPRNNRLEPIEESAAVHTLGDDCDAAWQLAKTGDWAGAYRRLCEIERRRPGNADICIRLYWLLTMQPALDAGCDRRDWLAVGLPAADFTGPLAELYGRELEGDCGEAMRPRCRKLFEHRGSFGSRAAFAMQCWGAIDLLEQHETIVHDLRMLQEDARASDRTMLARLLLACEGHLRWHECVHSSTPLAKIAEECRKQVEEMSEEHQALSYELDRSDYLLELTTGLRKLADGNLFSTDFVDSLRDLLHRGWILPFDAIRPQLIDFWRPMIENPRKSIADMGVIQRISNVVTHQLSNHANALYWLRHDDTVETNAAELTDSVIEFFSQYDWNVYETLRYDILSFCVRHRIAIEQFRATAVDALPVLRKSTLPHQLQCDLPLQCIVAASLAFME